MIFGKLNGVEMAKRRIENMEVAMSTEVVNELTLAALRVQRAAKRSIQDSPADPETGRSKPGNPPKTDTGRLVNSIFVDRELGEDGISLTVGTNVAYGRHLEFGTTTIEARPWLAPALEATRQQSLQAIAKAVEQVAKRLGIR